MYNPYIRRLVYCGISLFITTATITAQNTPKWTPEEQKELFDFCEKPVLVKKLNISEETADKVGEITLWALLQKRSVDANANEQYVTHGEVEEEVTKKLKALRLTGEQLKLLTERRSSQNPNHCAVATLSFHPRFDTIPQAAIMQLYKAQYRKTLIDKLGINGRQADQVFETEAWKQKEAIVIGSIPETDFDRIRKTVAMHTQRNHRYKVIGLSEEQAATAIDFFLKNPLNKTRE